MLKFLCFYIFFIYLFSFSTEDNWSPDSCMRKIFRECNHESSFTEQEIENARKYIQDRFWKTNPEKPPCSRLRVRKDIKCLSKKELNDFIYVFKQLYKTGIIDRQYIFTILIKIIELILLIL